MSFGPFTDEPQWPDTDRSILFLLDASTKLEEKLLLEWVKRRKPDASVDVGVARVPQSRRTRRRRRVDPRLERHLEDADPLVVPLRVVWLAPERDGERVARLRDLVTIGDPRDPDPVREHYLLRAHRRRLRIVAGEPAAAKVLEERWLERADQEHHRGGSFADFVALQAWLSLERAERRLRGNRYKVPKFVTEDITSRRAFAEGLAGIAKDTGRSFESVARDSLRYLKEIAARHSPYAIDVMAGATRWLIDRAYTGFHYDAGRLQELYVEGQRHPLVFLPSHKSNFDTLVLQYALYENELPPNHTAAGINMNFFPVGMLIRGVGYFFIRRTFKDNPTYKFVLQSYLEYLIEKRFPLEWYIEGGRSRSGKLREPRFGLLGYVVEAYHRGVADNVILIPVSINYDQIQDVRDYAAEQRGQGKESESFGWALNVIRRLRKRYGSIHMRFGETIELRSALGPPTAESVGDRLATQKLAFQVATHINKATPITPISLVTLALLSVGDRALTVTETMDVLEPFLDYVKERDLPTTVPLALDTPERVRSALDDLDANGVVSRYNGATATVYGIGHEQHLAAAYYRNTIIHFFVNAAIAELALLNASRLEDSAPESVAATFWNDCMDLRDLLKFEFFFAEKMDYQEEIGQELGTLAFDWEERLARGDARSILLAARPFRAGAVLKPFLEAYRIVADALALFPSYEAVDTGELIQSAIALGKQYEAQRRIQTAESVSTVLFDSAAKLAANRGLLERDADRSSFAAQIGEMVSRIYALDALQAGLDAGVTQ